MNHQEQELALEFNKGSKEAFTAIYKLLYHPLFLFARNFIPADDAADVVADTFFKLLKRHHNFDSFPDIRAFLYITARNACFDYLRHQKIKERQQQNMLALTEEEERVKNRAEIEAELIGRIRSEIENLSPRESEVLSLSFFDGHKNGEIAQMLNINDQTVRNVKTMALNKIRAAIFNRDVRTGVVVFSVTLINLFLDVIYNAR